MGEIVARRRVRLVPTLASGGGPKEWVIVDVETPTAWLGWLQSSWKGESGNMLPLVFPKARWSCDSEIPAVVWTPASQIPAKIVSPYKRLREAMEGGPF